MSGADRLFRDLHRGVRLERLPVARLEEGGLLAREQIEVALPEERQPGNSQQFFARAVEQLKAQLARFLDEDHQRHVLDDRVDEAVHPLKLIRVASFRTRVAQHDHGSRDGARLVAQRASIDEQPGPGAGVSPRADVHLDVVAGFAAERAREWKLVGGEGRDPVRETEAEEHRPGGDRALPCRLRAEQLLGHRVEEADAPLGIAGDDAVERRLEHRGERGAVHRICNDTLRGSPRRVTARTQKITMF